MNTQWPHNNKNPDTESCLPASLVSPENCIKTKISINIASNVFRFLHEIIANNC